MAHCFEYAVIRLAPNNARGERLNIGAVVFKPDGLDVRLAKRLEKVRAISAAIDTDKIYHVIAKYAVIDEVVRRGKADDLESRYKMLACHGPLVLSSRGTIVASDDAQYHARVEALLRDLVEPETAPKQEREKRSRLLTQVKKAFSEQRVLARRDETLDDHRLVPKIEVGEGLVADLVLKNGYYHVIETVDFSRDEDSWRKSISEIGISALTLESAKIRFGEKNTRKRLVYHASASTERHASSALKAAENQGCLLINWASKSDKENFVAQLSQLAIPLPARRRPRLRHYDHPRLLP